MRTTNVHTRVDAGLLIRDAAKLLPDPSRRLFLRSTASLGALARLTGCDIVDGPTSERALRIVSRFNDWVQARLFNPHRLADTYPESAITRPFPFNGYYPEDQAPDVDEDRYKLVLDGLVDNKQSWTLEDRKSTRLNSSHRCISYAVFCLKKKTKNKMASI